LNSWAFFYLRNYIQVKSDGKAGSMSPLVETGCFEIIGIA